MNFDSISFSELDVNNSPTIEYTLADGYSKICNNSPKEAKAKSKTLRKAQDQISDYKHLSALFKTQSGYYGGEILERYAEETHITVLLTRDQYGNKIRETCVLPSNSIVIPKRRNANTVNLYTIPAKRSGRLTAYNYIQVGEPIDTQDGLGAGIVGQRKNKKELHMVKYPIHNALTLHNYLHKEMLSNASSFISQMVDEYLHCEQFSDPIVDQACWLLNTVLYIDAHALINNEVLKEALANFCYDYKHLPKGTALCQPINYIYNALSIDGIWSKTSICISHIPTDFKGIQYKFI